MPDNLPADVNSARRELSEMYWHGAPEWDELIGAWLFASGVYGAHPKAPRRPAVDIALFPAASGLVVLDCDVREVENETGFVVHRDSERPGGACASLTPTVTRRGIDDLQRVVESLGHSMDELDTYTVRSKSGGLHLYFGENPRVPLKTSRHRENWLVDVKAHDDGESRGWVAAPPTPRYRVTRDLPVIELPTWLAEWLRDVESHLAPVGGARRVALRRRAADLKRGVLAVTGEERQGLLADWIGHELQVIADAQAADSGWNDAIFTSAANLAEAGWTAEDLIPVVEDVAQPRTTRDRNLMIGTVKSACKKVNRKKKWSTK